MIHFCPDELMAIQALFPFAQEYLNQFHGWWIRKFPDHKCHNETLSNCSDTKEALTNFEK